MSGFVVIFEVFSADRFFLLSEAGRASLPAEEFFRLELAVDPVFLAPDVFFEVFAADFWVVFFFDVFFFVVFFLLLADDPAAAFFRVVFFFVVVFLPAAVPVFFLRDDFLAVDFFRVDFFRPEVFFFAVFFADVLPVLRDVFFLPVDRAEVVFLLVVFLFVFVLRVATGISFLEPVFEPGLRGDSAGWLMVFGLDSVSGEPVMLAAI